MPVAKKKTATKKTTAKKPAVKKTVKKTVKKAAAAKKTVKKTMLGVINKLFDHNKREINALMPIVDKINAEEKNVQKLKDKDFAKKTQEFKDRLHDGEKLMDL